MTTKEPKPDLMALVGKPYGYIVMGVKYYLVKQHYRDDTPIADQVAVFSEDQVRVALTTQSKQLADALAEVERLERALLEKKV
jgi:hypothetical protein